MFYIQRAPINSALFSCKTTLPSHQMPPSAAPPCTPRPTHCPTGPSAHLRKHDLSMKGTPAHIQVGEGQPAALLNVRINGMPRSVRSINAGFFFLSNTTLPRSQKRSAFFFPFFADVKKNAPRPICKNPAPLICRCHELFLSHAYTPRDLVKSHAS